MENIESDLFATISNYEGKIENLNNLFEKALLIGIDVNYCNEEGITFLMKAIDKGYYKIFRLLLVHGADIEQTNNLGETAIHYAAKSPNTRYLNDLIKKNANINSIDIHGNVPINKAIKYRLISNIQILIDNDAVLNYLNKCGLSIYDEAILIDDMEVIEFLNNYKKKPKKRNIIKRILKK